MDDLADIEQAAEMFADAAMQDDEDEEDELDILVGLNKSRAFVVSLLLWPFA